jgi:hypothetical protein
MPDRNRNRQGARPEIEVAWYTKELGKPLQRELLQQQLARLSENSRVSGGHGEDTAPPVEEAPPQEDRAG